MHLSVYTSYYGYKKFSAEVRPPTLLMYDEDPINYPINPNAAQLKHFNVIL